METKSISWLHISDAHIGGENEDDSSFIRQKLIDSVKENYSTERKPDFIFFTGDLADGGKSEQYKLAGEFLDSLRETVGLEKRQVFIIPGNHDINRDVLETSRKKGLLAFNSEEANDCYKSSKEFFVWRKEYRKFVEDYYGAESPMVKVAGAERDLYFYRDEEKKVCIVGFDTAWVCVSNKEDFFMAAKTQCDVVSKEIRNLDGYLKIALLHHPCHELSDVDKGIFNQTFRNDKFSFVLTAHEHEKNVFRLVPEYGLCEIPVAAVTAPKEGEKKNGYIYVNLKFFHGTSPIEFSGSVEYYAYAERRFFADNNRSKGGKTNVIPIEWHWYESAKKISEPVSPKESLGSTIESSGKKYSDYFVRPGSDIDSYDDSVESTMDDPNNESNVALRKLWLQSMDIQTKEIPAALKKLCTGTIEEYQEIQKTLLYDSLDKGFSDLNLLTYFVHNHVKVDGFEVYKTASPDPKENPRNRVSPTSIFFGNIISSERRKIDSERREGQQQNFANKISFFIGQPGIGKTLTVAKIIDETIGKQNKAGFSVCPVYCDVASFLDESSATTAQDIMSYIAEGLHAYLQGFESVKLKTDTPNGLHKSINRIANKLANYGKIAFIILDNCDNIKINDAKYDFFKDNFFENGKSGNGNFERLHNVLLKLLKNFSGDEALRIGASIVFVCRNFTYRIIRKTIF